MGKLFLKAPTGKKLILYGPSGRCGNYLAVSPWDGNHPPDINRWAGCMPTKLTVDPAALMLFSFHMSQNTILLQIFLNQLKMYRAFLAQGPYKKGGQQDCWALLSSKEVGVQNQGRAIFL